MAELSSLGFGLARWWVRWSVQSREGREGTSWADQLRVYLLRFGIVLRPQVDEIVQMMRSQNRPVSGQVVEVVHDDGHEQVDDLQMKPRVEAKAK